MYFLYAGVKLFLVCLVPAPVFTAGNRRDKERRTYMKLAVIFPEIGYSWVETEAYIMER